jgi:hypothetical protein
MSGHAFDGTGMSPDRVIPLTPPGELWSQREYVACQRLGIEFAAHRALDVHGRATQLQWFHYGFPEDIGCTSVLVGSTVQRYVDHTFKRKPGWLDLCRAAVVA